MDGPLVASQTGISGRRLHALSRTTAKFVVVVTVGVGLVVCCIVLYKLRFVLHISSKYLFDISLALQV
jgi:hypothetical protein